MGQQQLLLIILGVFIIGVAVIIGIVLFNFQSIEVKKDNIHTDLITLASMAQQHFHRPSMMKGGGGSFDGGVAWTIPGNMQANDNATYSIENISSTLLVIKAVSTHIVSGNKRIVMLANITPSAFVISEE